MPFELRKDFVKAREDLPAGTTLPKPKEDPVLKNLVNKEDSTSLYRMFESPHFRETVDKLTEEELSLSEAQIIKRGNITPADRRLRLRLWKIYEKNLSHGVHRISVPEIAKRDISGLELLKAFTDKNKVLFLLSPPPSYALQAEEALSTGLDAVRELLDLPLVDPVTGKVNSSLAALKLRTVQWLDARVKGAIVQKVDQRNINLNVSADKVEESARMSVDEIDKKIAELEEKARNTTVPASTTTEVIDGELVDG